MYRKQLLYILLLVTYHVFGQQRPDTLYNPQLESKAYNLKQGSIIHIDEGHNNFHTKNNRFLPFARVLQKDGYKIKGFDTIFTKRSLSEVKILVISNALARDARPPFVRPTKSAFSDGEVKSLKKWVHKGGSLFLIADHMPFAGAASTLGEAFGFHFYDSFLFEKNKHGPIDFTIENSMLESNSISKGREEKNKIRQIRTFTGQAFKIPKDAKSILAISDKYVVQMPDTMWVFNEKTKTLNARGLSQGAYMEFGRGRVVIFGEAAMFTAQLAGPNQYKIGMNAKEASENYKLLLNIIHWLDRLY